MRRELQLLLPWSVAGVIILMSSLRLWTIRVRRDCRRMVGRPPRLVTHVETFSVQSSPPESPVVSPRTPPCECDSHSASSGPVAVPPQKPSVVAWCHRWPCISRVWSAATTQNGLNEPDPHSRNFCERYRRGGQHCNDGEDVTPCVDIFHVDPSVETVWNGVLEENV